MSKFTKLRKRIDALETDLETIRAPPTPSHDSEAVMSMYQKASDMYKASQEIATQLADFVQRAEKSKSNPDAAVYGPKMQAKVFALNSRFESLHVADVVQVWMDAGASLLEKEASAQAEREKKIAKEKEEEMKKIIAKRLADEKRRKELARAAEEEKSRLEEEAKKREAAAAKRLLIIQEREKRVREAMKRTPSESLSLIVKKYMLSDRQKLGKFLHVFSGLVSQIVREPSNLQWRKLRKHNASLRKNVLSLEGGESLLFSCGFRIKTLILTQAERLAKELRAYYLAFAPQELQNVQMEQVSKYYSEPSRNSQLWERLNEKYGKSRADLEELRNLKRMKREKRRREMNSVDNEMDDFDEEDLDKEGELYFVLEEPDPENGAKEWSTWYEKLKKISLELQQAIVKLENRKRTEDGYW
eukprot:g4867.t1